jgi:CheY-like chemotaxis protein
VILDLNLPGLDGHTILEVLRHMPAYATTPVLILSSAPKAVEAARCLQEGATAYGEKVADFATYRATVQSFVQHWLPEHVR